MSCDIKQLTGKFYDESVQIGRMPLSSRHASFLRYARISIGKEPLCMKQRTELGNLRGKALRYCKALDRKGLCYEETLTRKGSKI
jgi:hypothetical protein